MRKRARPAAALAALAMTLGATAGAVHAEAAGPPGGALVEPSDGDTNGCVVIYALKLAVCIPRM
jgi:hypothetical protein